MLAYNGLDVHIIENSNEQLVHAIAMIEQSLDKQMRRWALTQAEKKIIMNRIHPVESLAGLAECELVIETITEELESKRDIFEQLDRVMRAECDPWQAIRLRSA